MPTYDDSNQYLNRLEQLLRQPGQEQSPPAGQTAAAVAPPVPPLLPDQARARAGVTLEESHRGASNAASPGHSTPSTVPSFNADYEWLVAPKDLQETGLPATLIEDHLIRTVYFANELSGGELALECGLPYTVLNPMLQALTKDLYLDVKGQRGVGDMGYVYCLSSKGKARAAECLQRTWYRGTLPVPLDRYINAIRAQTVRSVVVTTESIRGAFSDLIIKEKILDQLGPAVNSGSSLFLFGAPGNGKTAIAERLTRCMGDAIYIPQAVEVDGYVIKLFDVLAHHEVDDTADRNRDRRWTRIRRPVVTVGGELTMAGLDLLWNDIGRYYEAPLQMKANGGIFFIDDFGRQIVRPEELLNRWIVPLEKRVDYLTLLTGKKIEVPFDELLVFSTNLNPEDLADEAFLRRIKFKVNAEDPDLPQFAQILQLVCRQRGVPYDEAGLRYMLESWWMPSNRPLRMCHPRDIVDQLSAIAAYSRREPRLVPDLIDRACRSYFID